MMNKKWVMGFLVFALSSFALQSTSSQAGGYTGPKIKLSAEDAAKIFEIIVRHDGKDPTSTALLITTIGCVLDSGFCRYTKDNKRDLGLSASAEDTADYINKRSNPEDFNALSAILAKLNADRKHGKAETEAGDDDDLTADEHEIEGFDLECKRPGVGKSLGKGKIACTVQYERSYY